MINREFFSRQLVLPRLGRRGQERLRSTRMLVAGLGGTGTMASVLLALGGVGELTLVDSDVVAVENLHRQPVYTLDDLGKAKAEVCASFIEERTRGKVRYHAERLDHSNAAALLNGCDIAVDCLDNLEGRHALNRACVEGSIPLVHTGALGWEGSVAVLMPPQTACLECLLPQSHADQLERCEEVGALGASTTIIGSLGALEAIKLASDVGSSLVGRILVIDFMTQQQRTALIAKRDSCSACGRGEREETGKRMISLCGAGEYYVAAAYQSAEFPNVVKSLPRSARPRIMGDSVVLARIGRHDVSLFKRGGILVRGASSEASAKSVVEAILRGTR